MGIGPTSVDYPRAVLLALAVTVAVTLVVAASTSTAAFGVYNRQWDGATDLRKAAAAAGTGSEVLLNTSRYESVRAPGTVAIVLSPDQRYGPTDVARLRRFVRTGGTLVVAGDFGANANPLLAGIGADARFDGSLLRDERYNYRSPAMPIARNVSGGPLVAGVESLTLNHGTVVEPHGTTVLVRSSEFGYLDANRNGELDAGERLGSYPVATVEPLGDGRVVAVSDPSLFVNAMLDRGGNRRFVGNLFGAHERAVLDYSHAGRLPVLAVALLVVRRTPTIQLVLGLAGLAAVVAWGRGLFGSVARRLPTWGPGRRGPPGGNRADATGQHTPGGNRADATGQHTPGGNRADVDDLAAYVRRQHPEWDERRVRRVTRSSSGGRGRDFNPAGRTRDR